MFDFFTSKKKSQRSIEAAACAIYSVWNVKRSEKKYDYHNFLSVITYAN